MTKVFSMLLKNETLKYTIKSLVGIFLVFFFGIVASAQTPKRIDFAKADLPSMIWGEKVVANKSKSFVFRAKRRQKLSLSFIDDTNEGSMDLGNLSVESNKKN